MPLYRESFVVAAEGLLKDFFQFAVHADGFCTRTKMSTYCRKAPGTCFPPEYGRVILEELVFQTVSKP